ncbi:MAG: redoxin domain-containing protein [Deltaproteobacteria bacterium]|nr:redoxin domain-containing protein [Deltaproteobacteria bacterium]
MGIKKLQVGDKAQDFDFQTPWLSRQNFYETMGNSSAILVFLRYQGCPVCQMEMAHLKREIGLFTQRKSKVFVFLQSSPETVASVTNEEDWPFIIVCDPQGAIFKKYAVEPGGIFKYLHPAGIIAAIKSISQGFRHGKFEGKETQLPAAFVINSMKVIKYAYYGRHISDIPTPATLAANDSTN